MGMELGREWKADVPDAGDVWWTSVAGEVEVEMGRLTTWVGAKFWDEWVSLRGAKLALWMIGPRGRNNAIS